MKNNDIKIKVLITITVLCSFFSSITHAIETDALVYPKETVMPTATSISPTTSLDTGVTISPKNNYVFTWGFRGSGQQGNGKNEVYNSEPPTRVNSFDGLGVVMVAGGAYHFVALDESGGVWAWGLNNYYQVGCKKSLSASSTPCKLLSNAVYIAAGEYISYALTKDGDIYAWGAGLYGQRGDGTTKQLRSGLWKVQLPEKARLLGGGYEGGYAVGYSGTIYAWGDDEDCAFGYYSSKDCSGHEYVSTPKPLIANNINGNDVIYIAGGQSHTTILLKNGNVYGIGRAASIGKGITDIKEGNSPLPYLIMSNVSSLYTRYIGSVAITDKGEIYTWGQTGGSAFPTIYGTIPTLRTPVGLDKDEYVVKIDGGKEHFYYTTNKGKIFGVGYGAARKLNDSSSANVEWPGIRMPFLENQIKLIDR